MSSLTNAVSNITNFKQSLINQEQANTARAGQLAREKYMNAEMSQIPVENALRQAQVDKLQYQNENPDLTSANPLTSTAAEATRLYAQSPEGKSGIEAGATQIPFKPGYHAAPTAQEYHNEIYNQLLKGKTEAQLPADIRQFHALEAQIQQAKKNGDYNSANAFIAMKNKMLQARRGISITSGPNGGTSVSVGGSDNQAGNIPGMQPFLDANGNPIAMAQPQAGVGKLPSRGGMFQTVNNPDGTSTVTYSPTTASRSALQKVQGANSELSVLQPAIVNGFSPYQGSGIVTLGKDLFNYSNPASRNRLINYLVARDALVEGSALRARLGQTEGGKEILDRFDKTYGNLPPGLLTQLHTLPPSIINASQHKLTQLLHSAASTRISQTGSGLHVNMPSSTVPAFLANQNPSQQGNLTEDNGKYASGVPQQPNNVANNVVAGNVGKVIVEDPKGNKFYLPASQLQDALSQGYRRG